MAVTIRVESSKELLDIFKGAGKLFERRLNKNLDIFLTKYKYRIFQLGLNSAGKKMPPAQLPRPKFARNPKSKAKGKKGKLPTLPFARNKVPPFLIRTGTLFDSIDVAISRGSVVIKIDYPTIILKGLEDRYGKIFLPTSSELLFFEDLLADEVQREIEKQLAKGKIAFF